jgi:cell division protein FtsI/penicillin-binding protein 2
MEINDLLPPGKKRFLATQDAQAQQIESSGKPSLSTTKPRRHWALSSIFAIGICSAVILANRSENTASAATPDRLARQSARKSVRASDIQRVLPESQIDLSFTGEMERVPGSTYPAPNLERVNLKVPAQGEVLMGALPKLNTTFSGRTVGLDKSNQYVFFSVNPELQDFVADVVKASPAGDVAVVAMDPRTGRVLAIAGKSKRVPQMPLHSSFPAASLFKVVTASAALERNLVEPESMIKFRGGNYTLNQWNYKPDARKDRRSMSLSEALGRSCNPVFGRIGLQYLTAPILRRYATLFGFNRDLGFDVAMRASDASVPGDGLSLSLTSAGFGDVTISPVHAAALMSGIANGGLMPKPYMVDRVVSTNGKVVYKARPEILQRAVRPDTAKDLLRMMEYTTTVGTSRKEFCKSKRARLGNVRVAAKTGTLKGSYPKGVNNWFIAAAPLERPQIALAVVVVNPSASSKASHVGRLVLEKFLDLSRRPASGI